jgi:hypothetical protein
MRWTPIFLLLPPVLAVVEDIALAFRTVFLLQERNLIPEAELDELTDVKVGLGTCLKVEVIPHAILQTETDIVARLLSTCTIWSSIEQWTLWSNLAEVIVMIVVIDMTRWIIEINSPVNHRCHGSELELIVERDTGTHLLRESIINILLRSASSTIYDIAVLARNIHIREIPPQRFDIEATVTIKVTLCVLGYSIIEEHVKTQSDRIPIVYMIYRGDMQCRDQILMGILDSRLLSSSRS